MKPPHRTAFPGRSRQRFSIHWSHWQWKGSTARRTLDLSLTYPVVSRLPDVGPVGLASLMWVDRRAHPTNALASRPSISWECRFREGARRTRSLVRRGGEIADACTGRVMSGTHVPSGEAVHSITTGLMHRSNSARSQRRACHDRARTGSAICRHGTMCLIPMISKPYGHMSSEESLGIDASDTCPPSFQPRPGNGGGFLDERSRRVELSAEPSLRPSRIGAAEGIA